MRNTTYFFSVSVDAGGLIFSTSPITFLIAALDLIDDFHQTIIVHANVFQDKSVK